MKVNRNTVIVLLALVVLASGCTDSTNTEGPAGTQAVQVVNYSAVPDTVFDSQQMNLRIRVKNVGDRDDRKAKVKIFGPPFGSSGNQEWSVDSINPGSSGDRVIDLGRLRSADEEAGVPATPREGIVTLTPPDLEDGVQIPYDFFARLAYEYQNRGVTEIQLMGDERYRDSSVTRAQPTLQNTDGPIHMEIRTKTPIVFYGGGQSTNSNLCIIVRNEGTGTPFLGSTTPTPDENNVDKVQLTLSSPGNIGFSPVSGSSSGGGSSTTVKVDLVGNRGMECFEFTNLQSEFQTSDIEQTLPITLRADYNYYTETQTSATVKGRP